MTLVFDRQTLNDPSRAATCEWLETDGLGGFAGSSILGANTRRYHGLLVPALQPPVDRRVLLSAVDEVLSTATGRYELASHFYPDTIHPRGFEAIAKFELDLFPVTTFEVPGSSLRRTLAMLHGESTTLLIYDLAAGEAELELRPFFAGRDIHALVRENAEVHREARFADGVLAYQSRDGLPTVSLGLAGSSWEAAPDWYRDFEYPREKERGFDFREDLFTPGVLRVRLIAGQPLVLIAALDDPADRDGWALFLGEQERRRQLGRDFKTSICRRLARAADQFIVKRVSSHGPDLHSLIAGYPWFNDWGRDTMIALPGICLVTGRFSEARAILLAFAQAVDQGLLPNRFVDGDEAPEYNTVDASLFFFVAVWRYLEATGDEASVRDLFLPVLDEILSWHRRGTRHGIREDGDGLLLAGAPGVQLTWMDAKVGDEVITPRHGKPVEIQALWYNALRIRAEIAERFADPQGAIFWSRLAERVEQRFNQLFFYEAGGYLYDVVDADGRGDASLRPNQIFALSLPFPLLQGQRAAGLLEVLTRRLLTPVGLRSLDPADPRYRARYEGGPAERDSAYHQGTVWSWLLGPYVTALVRIRGDAGKKSGRQLLRRLEAHLDEAGLGQISEIFDAEPPHEPRGAIAQAWSVGELLRTAIEDLELEKRPRRTGVPVE